VFLFGDFIVNSLCSCRPGVSCFVIFCYSQFICFWAKNLTCLFDFCHLQFILLRAKSVFFGLVIFFSSDVQFKLVFRSEVKHLLIKRSHILKNFPFARSC